MLYDAVRAVRLYRPLVVTSVFEGGLTDGHGQHQVSGEMAQEVFDAAGDPKMFPDQIAAGLMPWSPMKVYARVPFVAVSSKGDVRLCDGKVCSGAVLQLCDEGVDDGISEGECDDP